MNTESRTAKNINAKVDLATWPKDQLKANGYIRALPTGWVWTRTGEPYAEAK